MKVKKLLTYILSISLILALFRMSATAAEENGQEVLLSTAAKDAPETILNELDRNGVVYNADSLIEVVKEMPATLLEVPVSFVAVTTKQGQVCKTTTLSSFTEEKDGSAHQDNFAENLLISPMDSGTDINTWQGTKIVSECVYSRWTISGYNYVKPLTENFICTNTGSGVRPTKVSLEIELGGPLYNMNQSPPLLVQSGYMYHNTSFSANSPQFSKYYSYTFSDFPSSRAVRPVNADGGFHLVTRATINGSNYSYDYLINRW